MAARAGRHMRAPAGTLGYAVQQLKLAESEQRVAEKQLASMRKGGNPSQIERCQRRVAKARAEVQEKRKAVEFEKHVRHAAAVQAREAS